MPKTAAAWFADRRAWIESEWAPWESRTLGAHIEICAEKWGDDLFLIGDGHELSYAEVARQTAELAQALVAAGVEPGDRVGLLISNTPDMYVMKFAVSRAGATAVSLNNLLTPTEMRYVLGQCRPRLVVGRAAIGGRSMRTLMAETGEIPGMEHVLLADGMVTVETVREASKGQAGAEGEPLADRAVDPSAPTDIIYTSGSTGRPKGVLITHENFLRNAYGTAFARALQRGNRMISSLPPFHRFGYAEGVLPASFVGGAMVLEEEFDPERFIELMERHRVADLACVTRMAQRIMASPSVAKADLSSLRSVFSGGGDVVPDSYWGALGEVFGVEEITTAYGMTEHGVPFMARPDNPLELAKNTVGLPKPAGIAGLPEHGGIQSLTRIVDPESGLEVGVGVVGELQVKGPCVTPGYWDKPEENAATFVDGWQRTGDMGRLREDGALVLTGRLKDMYKSGSVSIVPREIELVIDAMDGVLQSYVVGIKDEQWGEAGCACVVLEPGADLGADKIIEQCRQQLARFKIPKNVVFLTQEELPRTTIGKVRKMDLVPLATERIAAARDAAR